MIVKLLLAEGAQVPLSRLSEEAQLAIAREVGALRLVDRSTLAAVAGEFADLLESVGLAAPGGMEEALKSLGSVLSPAATARLRAELAGEAPGGDGWPALRALDAAGLVRVMEAETAEVSAILLSKLPVARAAEVLARLPGDLARRIAQAVAQTAGVSPLTVQRIGRALAADYGRPALAAFDHPPGQRVGSILNESPSETRDGILVALDEADPAFGDAVRKAIFTFADIPRRLAPVDVPKVLRGIDPARLATAVAAAEAGSPAERAAADHILSNMSQRLAEQTREAARDLGRVKRAEGEAAMAAVVAAIRAAAEGGELRLLEPVEDAA